MMTWCVVHTQPSKELIAARHLRDQGFEVYLPQFKKIKRHARRVQEVFSPLFPRYIFVNLDLQVALWRSINGTRGVAHLLMSSEVIPAQVSSTIIDELKHQEGSDGMVPVSSLAVFAKGQKIQILEGAFKDQVATFESLSDNNRVQLLLTFLGGQTKVSLPVYSVEAA